MDSDARSMLMHRGLDDIFEPGLRASIGELIEDVRARGDAAVCDALAIGSTGSTSTRKASG